MLNNFSIKSANILFLCKTVNWNTKGLLHSVPDISKMSQSSKRKKVSDLVELQQSQYAHVHGI